MIYHWLFVNSGIQTMTKDSFYQISKSLASYIVNEMCTQDVLVWATSQLYHIQFTINTHPLQIYYQALPNHGQISSICSE